MKFKKETTLVGRRFNVGAILSFRFILIRPYRLGFA